MVVTLTTSGTEGTGLATYVNGLMYGLDKIDYPFEAIHEPGLGYMGRFLWNHYANIDGLIHATDPSVFHKNSDVVTIHDLHMIDESDQFGYVAFFMKKIMTRISDAKVLIVNSEHTRREFLRHFYWDRDRIVTTLLAPSLSMNYPEKIASSDEEPMILMVGDIKPTKANVEAVEAMAELDRNIILVRVGPEIQGSYGEKFLKNASAASNIEFRNLGYVSTEKLAKLFVQSDVLSFPSKSEGFGIPVLEAAKVGTPSVVSSLPLFDETIGDLGVRHDDLAEAFRMALDDPPSSEALKNRASMFSWEKTARDTAKAYRIADEI